MMNEPMPQAGGPLHYDRITILLHWLTALVTARSSPAHERVIRTLRAWDVTIDETFFMGGIAKSDVLAAFKPHMFFDDQPGHCAGAAPLVQTARVPVQYLPKGSASAGES
jgi:hypothetical protein